MRNLEKIHVAKILKRTEEIKRLIYSDTVTIDDFSIAETMEHLTIHDARGLNYRRVVEEARWGKPWSTAWFRIRLQIPPHFGGETVALLFEPEGESLIYRDGRAVKGLDAFRFDYVLCPAARGKEKIELYVEAAANGPFGPYGKLAKRTARPPSIAIFNREVFECYHDSAALAAMIDPEEKIRWDGKRSSALALDDTRRARIIRGLGKALDLFDYGNRNRAALRASARKVRSALKDIFSRRAAPSAQTIACIGHAHLDLAWLWPLAETVRKCGRTFGNVLDLMERYPDMIFCQSQPQLYEYAKNRYPEIYARVRKFVEKKQWVPTGCMWIEADCNITSGESFVRQILFGKRFFYEEFGIDIKDLWLPDVFGYSAALPQIAKDAGVDYFLTQKISWNQITRFPYHSFYWEGIDGTRLLTHFPPGSSYNSPLTANELLSAERIYREKDRCAIQACPYGYGDGGGGPREDMLERMRRYRDLEGMPKTVPMAARDFFERLEKESADLPVWVGELYLELHRGTLTTQAKVKRNNRKAEFLLRDVEYLSAINSCYGVGYPQAAIDRIWKTVLLNQFHDIIPGSSIARVYEDSERQFTALFGELEALRKKAVEKYVSEIDTRGDGRPVVVINTLSWERADAAVVEKTGPAENLVAVSSDGTETPVQLCADKKYRFIASAPPMGHVVYHLRKSRKKFASVKAAGKTLENDLLRVRFDRNGLLTSVFDKEFGRECIPDGSKANQFILFEDKPNEFDAWDIDIFYNQKPLEKNGKLVSFKTLEQGPVRSVIRTIREISKSTITQDIVLTAGSKRIDFETRAKWGAERDVLLKVAFPVDVKSDKARYEIQFGNIERPTHWSAPADFARFEVAAQRWADLSEGDFGVALLNDCKYGYDIRGNVIRLSLLRAPAFPDPSADINQTHLFTYALFPHTGDFKSGVTRAGYELNSPSIAVVTAGAKGAIGPRQSFFTISGDNVFIDTVKKAEEDDALVVRMYEAHACRGPRRFETSLEPARILQTDILEKTEQRLPQKGSGAELRFTPYKLRTIKLQRHPAARQRRGKQHPPP